MSSLSDLDFAVLHASRVRGVASSEQLVDITGLSAEEVAGAVERLAAAELVFERAGRRVSGWVLTEGGRPVHAEELAARMADQGDDFAKVYDAFLGHNVPLKSLCSRWQLAGTDEAARWQAIGDLEDLHEQASVVFASAGELVARFGRYGERLAAAVELVKGGDDRFFTSPVVDSYHTVWFEAHEDFLLSLGRDRAAEGSF